MDSAIVNDTEMVRLSIEKCHALLRSHALGRVAFVDRHGVALFPVNYVFDGRTVAVRCDVGSRLHHATQCDVAFEIDGMSDQTRTGWSVVLSGTAFDVTDTLDGTSVDVRGLPVKTWAPGDKGCWIRIEPRSISGRLVRPA